MVPVRKIAFSSSLLSSQDDLEKCLSHINTQSNDFSSAMKTIYWRATEPELRLLSHIDWASSYYHAMLHTFFDVFWEGDFLKNAKRIFHEYYKEIRSIVPPDSLLEYNISQGWAPLCEFLGEEIPCGVPFPHVNDTDSFVARCRSRNRRQIFNVVFRWMVIGGMLCGILIVLVYLMVGSGARRM